jgi:predicted Rossmann fold nucleotide-binding protein DprA/Smf involved in DNA uptake
LLACNPASRLSSSFCRRSLQWERALTIPPYGVWSSRRIAGLRAERGDTLAEVSGLPIREVRVAVMTLDLAGRIEHSGGACVALLVGE